MAYGDDITYPLDPETGQDKAVGFILGAYADDPTSVRIAVVDPDEYIELGEVTLDVGPAVRDSEPMPMWTAYLADPPGMPGLVERMEQVGLAHKELLDGKLVGHSGADGAWQQRFVLDRVQFNDYDRLGSSNYEMSYDNAIVKQAAISRGDDGRPRLPREYTKDEIQQVQRLIAEKMTAGLGVSAPTPEQAAEARHARMEQLRSSMVPSMPAGDSAMATLVVDASMVGGPDARLARIKASTAMRQGYSHDQLVALTLGSRASVDIDEGMTVSEWQASLLEDTGIPALKVTMPSGTVRPSGRDVSGMVATIPYFGKAKPRDFERPGATPSGDGTVKLMLPASGVVSLALFERNVDRVETVRTAKLIEGADGLAHGQWHERQVSHESVRLKESIETTAGNLFSAVASNPEHARILEAARQRAQDNAARCRKPANPADEMTALRNVASAARCSQQRGNQKKGVR